MPKCWQAGHHPEGRCRENHFRPWQIEKEIESGKFPFRDEYEDIHMNVEARLKRVDRRCGRAPSYGAFAERPGRDGFPALDAGCVRGFDRKIGALQATLKKLSSKHGKAVMPGFTHLQAAQPVTLGSASRRLLSNAQPGQDAVCGLRASG
jgi:hypothetical protein